MPEYILADCVEDELWGIWKFIAVDNSEAATHFVEAAYRTLKTLAASPGIGRLRRFRSLRLQNIRSWRVSGFDNYLVFYRAVPEGIHVLHIFHGAWDIESLFGK